MGKRKTRKEKARSEKRRKKMFSMRAKVKKRKDRESFSYLSREYIKKDLLKSAGVSVLVTGLLLGLYFYLR